MPWSIVARRRSSGTPVRRSPFAMAVRSSAASAVRPASRNHRRASRAASSMSSIRSIAPAALQNSRYSSPRSPAGRSAGMLSMARW